MIYYVIMTLFLQVKFLTYARKKNLDYLSIILLKESPVKQDWDVEMLFT